MLSLRSAVAAYLLPVALIAVPAGAAELAVLGDDGRTISLVDTTKLKVVRSTTLKSNERLVTFSVNSVQKEIWGVTHDDKLLILDYDTFDSKAKSDPIAADAYGDKIIYCTDESVYCNFILSRRSAAALNEEGSVLLTADLPKASYRPGRPRLIGFGSVSDPENPSSSKVFAIDGDQNALIRLPPTGGAAKWKLVGKLDKPVAAPLAFDTVRENGTTRGYILQGTTLYGLNLKNARLTRPQTIKGLKGSARAMSFYAAPSSDTKPR